MTRRENLKERRGERVRERTEREKGGEMGVEGMRQPFSQKLRVSSKVVTLFTSESQGRWPLDPAWKLSRLVLGLICSIFCSVLG